MSCGCGTPTFRLLDGVVGWDDTSSIGLDGLDRSDGVRLARLAPGVTVPEAAVWPYVPPPRIAYDCRACTWYLATTRPPRSRLLALGPCDPCGAPWPQSSIVLPDRADIVAVAAHDGVVAVASHQDVGAVSIHAPSGAVIGRIGVAAGATHVAFVSRRQLVIATRSGEILRVDPAGVLLGRVRLPVPAADLVGLAGSADGAIWVVTAAPGPDARLLRWRRNEGWRDATLQDLRASLPDTGLELVADEGFCLRRPARAPRAEPCCVSWYGRPQAVAVPAPSTDVFVRQGQLLTQAIDSGMPRCRWHRVRVTADVPVGTSLEIAVASAETTDGVAPQGVPDPAWPGFPGGVPHPADWQVVPDSQDFLVDQPPGRFLYVRARMTGDGAGTPLLRGLRLDFPRATSVDFLPAVYREDPRAEDFTERFVSLVDATLEDLDEAVARFPALVDAGRAPGEALPWIARFLGAVLDPGWDVARRRRILAELPALYHLRGTPEGLARAVELVFDRRPAIEEEGAAAVYAAVADPRHPSALDARIGALRLFGRRRARLRLGVSALSRTPLRTYGDPSLDALTEGVYRVKVSLPAQNGDVAELTRRLRALVDSQAPAHVVASVRVGSGLATVGAELRVGIDTQLALPPPRVIGRSGTLRLRRDAILRGRARDGAVVGHSPVSPSSC